MLSWHCYYNKQMMFVNLSSQFFQTENLHEKQHFRKKAQRYCHIFLVFRNTRIYNLISVPRITWFLLRDTIISSKADPHNGSKKKKRCCGKAGDNKTTLKILSFIRIIYFKQQSSILWCFCRLKFEKSLFNSTFLSFIFRCKMTVHTAEKKKTKYFTQN